MTADELKHYQETVTKRFTWEPGDLVKIGHKPLTEEEKRFVEEIKRNG